MNTNNKVVYLIKDSTSNQNNLVEFNFNSGIKTILERNIMAFDEIDGLFIVLSRKDNQNLLHFHEDEMFQIQGKFSSLFDILDFKIAFRYKGEIILDLKIQESNKSSSRMLVSVQHEESPPTFQECIKNVSETSIGIHIHDSKLHRDFILINALDTNQSVSTYSYSRDIGYCKWNKLEKKFKSKSPNNFKSKIQNYKTILKQSLMKA